MPIEAAPSEVGGNAFGRCGDGLAGFQRGVKAAASLRFDGDNLDAAGEPGGDAGDEAAATDGNEDRVEVGRLRLPFARETSLAGDGLRRVVSVDGDGADFFASASARARAST